MLRLVARRAANVASSRFSFFRSYATSAHEDVDPVAVQMINYSLSHARTQRSGGSYAEALLVLEQGLSNLSRLHGSSENAKGTILLTMSTLLAERGDFDDAMEKLQLIQDLELSSLSLRVAAWEALIGLQLQKGQDVASSALADKCLQLLRVGPKDNENAFKILDIRAKAIKGLVNLVLGDLKSAELDFAESNSSPEDIGLFGNTALSYGEFLHATGNFSSAKCFYQNALQVSKTKDFSNTSVLAAACMVSEEVLLGATCALGQLATHTGNFHDAEEMLTEALRKAEEHFGSNHPKVGVVLTCLAIMFGRKARLEGSSSLVIQEGLYRRAIGLLKGSSLDVEDLQVNGRDIVALARGIRGFQNLSCHDGDSIRQNYQDTLLRLWRRIFISGFLHVFNRKRNYSSTVLPIYTLTERSCKTKK